MDSVGKFFSLLINEYYGVSGSDVRRNIINLFSLISKKEALSIIKKFSLDEYKSFIPIYVSKFGNNTYGYYGMRIPYGFSVVSYDGKTCEDFEKVCPLKTEFEITWTDRESYVNTIRVLADDGQYYVDPKYLF